MDLTDALLITLLLPLIGAVCSGLRWLRPGDPPCAVRRCW